MRSWITILAFALCLCAGCSGSDFKKEILGGPPQELDASSRSESPPPPPPPPAAPQPARAPASSPPGGYAPAARATPAAIPAAPTARPAVAAPLAASPASGTLTYQVGSFAHQDNAASLRDLLAGKGCASRVESASVNGRAYYRVLADLQGPSSRAEDFLRGLGITEPRLISGQASPTPSAVAPPAASAARPVPAATPAPAAAPQTVPAATPAPAATPQTAPAVAPAPAVAAAEAAPVRTAEPEVQGAYPHFCNVSATRIEAVGRSRGQSDALMAKKEAVQDAKRNLLICIDAFKNKGRGSSKSYKIEAYLPEGVLSVGDPVTQSDGSLAVRASMAVRDVDSVNVKRVE